MNLKIARLTADHPRVSHVASRPPEHWPLQTSREAYGKKQLTPQSHHPRVTRGTQTSQASGALALADLQRGID